MMPFSLHLVRPEALWALLLLPLIAWLLHRLLSSHGRWHQYIDAELLHHLAPGSATLRKSGGRWALASLIWALLVVAVAGPSWEQRPVPVMKSEAATVYLLDLSPSMLAEDLKPSRLVRAQQKLSDALDADKEGLKGLVVFAGEAHVVTPLTDDARTLQSLVPSLSPYIMPLAGSNVEMAMTLATDMLVNGGIQRGQLVLITDGITADSRKPLADTLRKAGYPLYVISLGDESGAPIPLGQQGFAKNANGEIVIAKNNRELLRALAADSGGAYQDLSLNDSDLGFLQQKHDRSSGAGREVDRELEQWIERGHWLVWLALPLILLAMKQRSALFSLLLLGLMPALTPIEAEAQATAHEQTRPVQDSLWQRLWYNADQLGKQALDNNQPETAKELFADPKWQAQAQYHAGDFNAALKSFEALGGDGAEDWYNLGNAQAQAGQLDDAIASYERALAQAPGMEDAHYNKSLVEQLKNQEQEKNQDQGQQSEDNSQPTPSENQQAQNQQQDQNNSQSDQNGAESPQQNAADDQNTGADEKNNRQNQPETAGSDANQQPDQSTPEQNTDTDDGTLDDRRGQQPEKAQPPASSHQESGVETTSANGKDQPEQATSIDAFSHLTDEQRQAAEQWLKRIEDDPSNLLKRKFEYQYRQRKQAIRDDQWTAPENNAHERW